ncbi:contractile injection system tape measure protein [Variovorax sp. ZS18.2.2]|uniref:contractile injection system tape measure protein n=1 Tax=Variovorax sp. ZS18.2.2 TaxID=2971255 RepID=UPI002150E52E|nr:contractile injection system tape measure protein [Variovorax sp. ZS18.2.2]MCR6476990.1 contractile injection system tape measure protein [Variovorax sp. ZS18.2.2]
MNTHRVRRLRWRASAPSPAEAFALRTLLRAQGEACEAALDRAFDKAVPRDEVWHLPRLALEVRLADLRGLSAGELSERIEAAVRAALAAAERPVKRDAPAAEVGHGSRSGTAPATSPFPEADIASSRRSTAIEARQALKHYMARGLLPWTLAGLAPEEAQRVLAEAAVRTAESVASGAEPLRSVLPDAADTRAAFGALLRWLPLLPAALRRRLLAVHWPPLPLSPATLESWRAWIDSDAIDRIEWQAVWLAAPLGAAALRELVAQQRAVAGAPPFLASLQEALVEKPRAQRTAHPSSRTEGGKTSRAPTTKQPHRPEQKHPLESDAATTAEPLLVPLAGLVLLHPWLPRMLAGCGVLDEGGKQILPDELPRACVLLHALACDNAPIAEHQLPFIKLLLGRPPDEPLTAALPALSLADCEEVDALLTAVRDHWSALRGTGIEGLRLSFLQRRGLLSRGDGTWHLRMQSEAFDMLMAMLPWRIEQVRLPWMPKLLIVEWPTP